MVLLALTTTILFLALSSGAGAQVTSAPVFEGKTTLLRPVGYREWVFVGSSLGLSYAQNPQQAPGQSSAMYHNVYIHPAAYREFARTGKFPQGTMMDVNIVVHRRALTGRLLGILCVAEP